jgi:hypothetical protein
MAATNHFPPYLFIYPGIVVRAWHDFDKTHITGKETVSRMETMWMPRKDGQSPERS